MNHNDKFISKRTIGTILILVFCIFFTGSCSLESTYEFPNISYSSASITPTKTPKPSDSTAVSSGTLKIALPLSDECLHYLSLMYAGEKSGLFTDTDTNSNGLTVPLATLDAVISGLNTVLQVIPSTGYTQQEMNIAASSNLLPDIMLFCNNDNSTMNGFSKAVFDSSILNSYSSTAIIYPAMIQNGLSNASLQSLPYYASIKMLYANTTILIDGEKSSLLSGTGQIDFKTVQTLAKKITKPDTGIYGLMGLPDLLSFFPMTLDSTINSYMWNGVRFDFSKDAFSKSIIEIKNLITSGSVVDSLNATQKKVKYGELDPRILNKIGFWIDDSNKLETWKSLSSSNYKRYPIQGEEQITIPLSIYSIAVNSNSALLEEAKQFAAYLAFDRDALLFRSRYANPNGFIPPIKDDEVWKNLVKTQLQGEELYALFDKMENAKSITNDAGQFVKATFGNLFDKYFNDILYSRKSFSTFVEEINKEANQAMNTP